MQTVWVKWGRARLGALVDDDMLEKVSQFKWWFDKSKGGAISRRWIAPKKYETLRMHRVVMDAPFGVQVDHIDGNRLNNQKSNLRLCTNQQNAYNKGKPKGAHSSQFLGVTRRPGASTWMAKVGKNVVGMYNSAEDAALARDYFLRRSEFSEFGQYNFPDRDENPSQSLGRWPEGSLVNRKHVGPTKGKKGQLRYHVQIRHGRKVIGTTAATLEAAISRRNEILRELGRPIPD